MWNCDIDTTTNYPFYVLDKSWVAAGDLIIGDKVYQLDGSTAVVTGFELEILSEPIKVYNLEVEDYHTYFVGDVPVLVHNNYKPDEPLNDSDLVVRGGESAAKTLIDNQKNELVEFGGKTNRGSMSANGGTESLEILAKYGTKGNGFSQGKIGYTTAGEIRALEDGWQVIHSPTKDEKGKIINPYHIAIIPPNGTLMTDELAFALSKLFQSNLKPNTFKK